MTPENQTRLAERRWLVRARTVRRVISPAVAAAIEVGESDLAFSDRDTTTEISELFARRATSAGVIEVPARSAAIELVQAELGGSAGPAFFLPDGYDDCGVMPIDFAVAIFHVDALLESQNEIFRLIGANGNKGACIFTQEGVAEDYHRFVQLWKHAN